MSIKTSLSKLNWGNTIFLIVSPIIAWIFVPHHLINYGLNGPLLAIFSFLCVATSISITGGYHRLFAHRSYEASKFVRLFYLIFGAAALQGSAMKWSTDHRRHHSFVDTDKDPYSIKKGFWYAHIGWIFFKEEDQYKDKFAPDLQKDPMMVWQNKYYYLIAIIVGFLIPGLIGWSFGHAWGGVLFGGFARVVFTHHSTFLINSACHYFGKQPFGDKNTARDSALLAFFTYGEGYHNFHHRFQLDYRNGIRWYQWDPTKWIIWIGERVGWTWNLKKVSDEDILRARLLADEKKLLEKGHSEKVLEDLRQRIESAQAQYRELRARYRLMKQNWRHAKAMQMESARESLVKMKRELELAKIEFRAGLAQWRMYLRYN